MNMQSAKIYIDMDGTVNHWDLNGNPHEEHYFLYREPFENVLRAVRILKESGFDIAFATSVYMNGNAKADKLQWLKEQGMSDIPVIFVPYGENKDDYLQGEHKILIDDHTPNLLNFTGMGVKLINRDNHKNGVWQGKTLRYDDDPYHIAACIGCWVKYEGLENDL